MEQLGDIVEETVPLAGRQVVIARPRDSEALIDERRFEHDEYMPYWAELWPSALALAREIAGRSLRGARVLELGSGLGLVSVAAALAGGRVTASDWSLDSVRFTAANAERNGVTVEAVVADWVRPARLLEGTPWNLVLASDVLYEARNVDVLLDLLPRLVDERGNVWVADPGRPTSARFLERLAPAWSRTTKHVREGGVTVALHHLSRPA